MFLECIDCGYGFRAAFAVDRAWVKSGIDECLLNIAHHRRSRFYDIVAIVSGSTPLIGNFGGRADSLAGPVVAVVDLSGRERFAVHHRNFHL